MTNEIAREASAEQSRTAQQPGAGLRGEYLNIMHERMHQDPTGNDSVATGQKTAESDDPLVRQPESSKNDNPVYKGCSTKQDNSLPGMELLPEVELFDSRRV